jgi:hypothetical protein
MERPVLPRTFLPHEADLIRVSPTAHHPRHTLVCVTMGGGDQMKMKRIAIAVAAVTSFASIGGVALATTPAVGQNTAATSSEPTTDADTDTIQAGDQTTPDAGTEATSDADGEQATETEGGSDGHGGHEDPPGEVNHQFDGQE